MSARTHARARNAPTKCANMRAEVGEVLPGGLVVYPLRSYTARAALLLARSDPGAVLAVARDLDALEAGAVLLAAGDAALTRGDAATAATAYRRARHAVQLDLRGAAADLEAAACYGLALVTAGRGDGLRAARWLDAADRLADLVAVRDLGERLLLLAPPATENGPRGAVE